MKPTHIVIHHSLTPDGSTASWNAIRWYHINTNGWSNIGYHLGVENISGYYEILLGRMLNETGAHCKEGGMNHTSLGICCVGNYDLMRVPDAMMDRLVELARSLMDTFHIPKENVKRHTDFASYKTCPGKMFQWSEFIGRI